ncbi:uncharacterized protein LOC115625195 [Scaptodrosophila lebanonensis]|uniref:Uncharacterized protein LOC115625195 n=1 Tax=Drosophila lebanonensis TaxID=7225 RepID=A0A6J2TH46_DROLE|nr:uncharacterized protein LOC115625195 [Scaptodrosophila lebanonensis]
MRLLLLSTWFIVGIETLAHAQVAFVEEGAVDKQKANLAGRKPLYSPSRCKKYELLYPGDQFDDWICDCAPAALYHPDSDACFPAYRQGPCKSGEMLVLYKDKIIPECVSNPCREDNHFMIQGKCYEFGNNQGHSNPCPLKEYTYVLGVNPKTLMVDCIQLSLQLQTRFGEEDATLVAPPDYHIEVAQKCGRGSRMSIQGRCVATQ